MNEPKFIIEEITDPVETARFRAQDEQPRRNLGWLQAHGAEQQRPKDQGAPVQYVLPEGGPCMYGNRWGVMILQQRHQTPGNHH